MEKLTIEEMRSVIGVLQEAAVKFEQRLSDLEAMVVVEEPVIQASLAQAAKADKPLTPKASAAKA